MAALREENAALRTKLDQYGERITELEGMVSAFKEDQAEIEHGIITALEKLDEIEDAATDSASDQARETAPPPEDEVSVEEPSPEFSEDEEDSLDDEEESTTPSEAELDIF